MRAPQQMQVLIFQGNPKKKTKIEDTEMNCWIENIEKRAEKKNHVFKSHPIKCFQNFFHAFLFFYSSIWLPKPCYKWIFSFSFRSFGMSLFNATLFFLFANNISFYFRFYSVPFRRVSSIFFLFFLLFVFHCIHSILLTSHYYTHFYLRAAKSNIDGEIKKKTEEKIAK